MLTRERTRVDSTPELVGSREVRFWIGVFGVFVTTLALTLVGLTFLLSAILGYRPVVVISGSMEPGISFGDVVLYDPHSTEGIGAGSVIVSSDPTTQAGTKIHRVVAVDEETGWLQTKGDANRDADSTWVTDDSIEGVAKVLIHFAGLPAALMQTGRIALAVLLIAFVVLCAWLGRMGWYDRFDPWIIPARGGPAP